MKTNKDPGLIPDAAALNKEEFIALFVDKQGFIEKTLRETASSFGKTLSQSEQDVNSLRSETGKAVTKLASGEKVDLHQMMAAADKARASFNQLAEMRDKVIDAYREILKMRK